MPYMTILEPGFLPRSSGTTHWNSMICLVCVIGLWMTAQEKARTSPFSTKLLLPKENAGALVSLGGLFTGVYVHGPGPSMSMRRGGRALVAWSHVITLLTWLGSTQLVTVDSRLSVGRGLEKCLSFFDIVSRAWGLWNEDLPSWHADCRQFQGLLRVSCLLMLPLFSVLLFEGNLTLSWFWMEVDGGSPCTRGLWALVHLDSDVLCLFPFSHLWIGVKLESAIWNRAYPCCLLLKCFQAK